ncbi:hypothetical protein L198_01527 [Cryptococcus wingfieldii CBS 7118]|uniref:LysM domain-containing protein n=1 Tax=Cryptococcus wingfieldii CBS 7118 TaxID=1295528 RepID=A0A1E3JZS5_9TREE|nr:hypothetical protein L198_01527 [Cryptococcus wingfieldii CBS 7118]ODO06295.1 hypothetical protein L198_01527 [Cryptococcus wingfieldii CBS 7118]
MLTAIAIAVLPFLSARQYGVSTYQLALVNDAEIDENCDNLEPDQSVCLGIEGQDCTKVYTVVANDTCAWVQEMYGISNETLYSNNPQIDAACENIYIGEVLCVDTDAFAYPDYNSTLYDSLAYTYLPYCDEQ